MWTSLWASQIILTEGSTILKKRKSGDILIGIPVKQTNEAIIFTCLSNHLFLDIVILNLISFSRYLCMSYVETNIVQNIFIMQSNINFIYKLNLLM